MKRGYKARRPVSELSLTTEHRWLCQCCHAVSRTSSASSSTVVIASTTFCELKRFLMSVSKALYLRKVSLCWYRVTVKWPLRFCIRSLTLQTIFLRHCRYVFGNNFIIQNDNTRPHIVRLIIRYLKEDHRGLIWVPIWDRMDRKWRRLVRFANWKLFLATCDKKST